MTSSPVFGSRGFGIATLAAIGSTIDARGVALNTDAGFYMLPRPLPKNIDPSRPSYLTALLAPATNAVGTYTAVLQLLVTLYRANTLLESSFTQTVQLPTNWLTTTPVTALLDDGSGVTFPAATFHPDDWLGLRFMRLGSQILDTFPATILLAMALDWTYSPRCQLICCP